MIDSTNPRILANNIRKLFAKVNSIVPGTVVEGNPSGSGFNTLLTKIKIGSNKYKLPADVTANPEGEAIGSLSKLGIGSGIYSVGASLPDYSTTEYLIGRKWIDNSDIYEKVINTDLALNTSWQNYVDLTGFDKIISVENIILTRDGEQISIAFSNEFVVAYIIRDGYLKFAVNITGTLSGTYVLKSITIKYTKAVTP